MVLTTTATATTQYFHENLFQALLLAHALTDISPLENTKKYVCNMSISFYTVQFAAISYFLLCISQLEALSELS